jgi:hypothetical protein
LRDNGLSALSSIVITNPDKVVGTRKRNVTLTGVDLKDTAGISSPFHFSSKNSNESVSPNGDFNIRSSTSMELAKKSGLKGHHNKSALTLIQDNKAFGSVTPGRFELSKLETTPPKKLNHGANSSLLPTFQNRTSSLTGRQDPLKSLTDRGRIKRPAKDHSTLSPNRKSSLIPSGNPDAKYNPLASQ